jgi:hypothetical protein
MNEGGERGWRLRASGFYQAAFQVAIQAKCRDDCRCFKWFEHRYLRKVDVAEMSGLQQKRHMPQTCADTSPGMQQHDAFTRCLSWYSSRTKRGCISNQSRS